MLFILLFLLGHLHLGFRQALLQLFDLGRVLCDGLLLDVKELLQRHLLLLQLL